MATMLTDALALALGQSPPERLGVAVSGGGDSVALLAALVEFAEPRNIKILAVTVDHGIRPEAKDEAAFVSELCANWSVPHHVLTWDGWTGQGNFQAAARDARYGLMTEWACAHDIKHIALGHTADDQAETVLMRLGRGAGVDGLSAMALRLSRNGIEWLRPFLEIRRAALRDFLRGRELDWHEDPSNENRDYARIKARDALTEMETVGISVPALLQVAKNMKSARAALNAQAKQAAHDLVTIRGGAVALKQQGFLALPDEIQRRLLVHSFRWISGAAYAPRGMAVERVLASVLDGSGATLEGCQIILKDGHIWVFREHNAIRKTTSPPNALWDNRWRIRGEAREGVAVRALGFEALAKIEGWRDIGVPRAALASSPSVWHNDNLIAAPLARPEQNWSVELYPGPDSYFAALLSH